MLRNKPKERTKIGTRNGLNIFSKLKSKSVLKSNEPINKVSKVQQRKNKQLSKARDILKAKAGELCMMCHNPPDFRGLSVHHIIFRSKGGTNDPSNLILVCADCHDRFHHKR